jgi:hypothetical protein
VQRLADVCSWGSGVEGGSPLLGEVGDVGITQHVPTIGLLGAAQQEASK